MILGSHKHNELEGLDGWKGDGQVTRKCNNTARVRLTTGIKEERGDISGHRGLKTDHHDHDVFFRLI